MSGRRCMHVDQDTTREGLLALGVSPEAADELLAFRDRLLEAERETRRTGDRAAALGKALQDLEGAETPPSDTTEQGGAG